MKSKKSFFIPAHPLLLLGNYYTALRLNMCTFRWAPTVNGFYRFSFSYNDPNPFHWALIHEQGTIHPVIPNTLTREINMVKIQHLASIKAN